MEKEDILHLGRLARISISEEEAESLMKDIPSVLEYVSTVNEIAAMPVKEPGPVHNVFRADEPTTEPGVYRDALLAEAPASDRNMLVVKKILDTE